MIKFQEKLKSFNLVKERIDFSDYYIYYNRTRLNKGETRLYGLIGPGNTFLSEAVFTKPEHNYNYIDGAYFTMESIDGHKIVYVESTATFFKLHSDSSLLPFRLLMYKEFKDDLGSFKIIYNIANKQLSDIKFRNIEHTPTFDMIATTFEPNIGKVQRILNSNLQPITDYALTINPFKFRCKLYYEIRRLDKKVGLIDLKGAWVVPPKYSKLVVEHDAEYSYGTLHASNDTKCDKYPILDGF